MMRLWYFSCWGSLTGPIIPFDYMDYIVNHHRHLFE